MKVKKIPVKRPSAFRIRLSLIVAIPALPFLALSICIKECAANALDVFDAWWECFRYAQDF